MELSGHSFLKIYNTNGPPDPPDPNPELFRIFYKRSAFLGKLRAYQFVHGRLTDRAIMGMVDDTEGFEVPFEVPEISANVKTLNYRGSIWGTLEKIETYGKNTFCGVRKSFVT